MRTDEFLAAFLGRLPADCVLVSSLGRTSEELFRLAPRRTLFTDTMGDVSAISTGMAVAMKPLPVAAVDTDGSFLMNLSVLPTLGSRLPALDNHTLVIVDNGIYESAGGMPSRTGPLDWRLLFAAVGLTAVIVRTPADLPGALPRPGVVLVAEVVNDGPAPDAAKSCDGVESSYAVERLIATLRGRAPRRPALKA
ncbi:thiamine pyrophosphate-dependent enzyme [Streptomyces yaizuensis]|uniref:Thiamine pyrophosphate-dependent enzyme n=1 Tax=Streptomyces yaizuensis TaxID=2989713 RepID=A0ABQ5NR99_9ACTN|nr:thiamine pyrophosphate-dependent enzyme [Streptomyces sp. YSPA8]GLF92913.1 thiamine pyrophosphate-dependent enzyme [Streptomyces sp. YSPA8]